MEAVQRVKKETKVQQYDWLHSSQWRKGDSIDMEQNRKDWHKKRAVYDAWFERKFYLCSLGAPDFLTKYHCHSRESNS